MTPDEDVPVNMENFQPGRNLPGLPLAIDHISLNVADLDRSLRFYCRTLGLELAGENEEIFLRLPGTTQTLGFVLAQSERPQRPEEARHAVGLSHLAFRVSRPHFLKIVQSLQEGEQEFTGPVRRTRSESLYFDDPDGNRLEIISWDKR